MWRKSLFLLALFGLIIFSIGAQTLVQIPNGGTGAGTAAQAVINLLPAPTRAGDNLYWNGSNWVALAGNNSGVSTLHESASGVPSWVNLPVQYVVIPAVDFATAVTTGNGIYYFTVPLVFNGESLVSVSAQDISVGTTGQTQVQLTLCSVVATGNACSGTTANLLTTVLSIDSGQNKSSTSANPPVIGTNTLATDQIIRVDVAAVSSTAPNGLILTLGVH